MALLLGSPVSQLHGFRAISQHEAHLVYALIF